MSTSRSTLTEILHKLGLWLRGKLLIALILSVLTYFGLRLIGVEYSVPLAILSGFLDLVPVLGPLLALVIAAGMALVTGNLTQTLWVILLYFALQQLEAFVLEPKILAKSVGLNAWLVLLFILLGSFFFGPLGALLAVPVLIILTVLYATSRAGREEDETVD